jgi:hypothetical protein
MAALPSGSELFVFEAVYCCALRCRFLLSCMAALLSGLWGLLSRIASLLHLANHDAALDFRQQVCLICLIMEFPGGATRVFRFVEQANRL